VSESSKPSKPNYDVTVAVWEHVSGSTWQRSGKIPKWTSMSVELRHITPGPFTLAAPWTPDLPSLTDDDLLTFDFAGVRATCTPFGGIGYSSDDKGKPVLNVSGAEAKAALGWARLWQQPTVDPSGTFTMTPARYVATGAAEDIMAAEIQAQLVDRLGFPLTVAPSQGRGATVHPNQRITPMSQVIEAQCHNGGLGVSVDLVSDNPNSTTADLTVSFYEPVDRSDQYKLSHKAGTLTSWQQSTVAPTATRTLVGGGGQGTARVFRLVVDPADSGKLWKRETFTDARDIDPAATDAAAQMDQRGQADLAAAAAQSSFTLESAEAEGQRFGSPLHVGDSVAVSLLTGANEVMSLNAVVFARAEDGTGSITYVPGNPDGSDPSFKRGAITQALSRRIGHLEEES
jgi:hypothetical protein